MKPTSQCKSNEYRFKSAYHELLKPVESTRYQWVALYKVSPSILKQLSNYTFNASIHIARCSLYFDSNIKTSNQLPATNCTSRRPPISLSILITYNYQQLRRQLHKNRKLKYDFFSFHFRQWPFSVDLSNAHTLVRLYFARITPAKHTHNGFNKKQWCKNDGDENRLKINKKLGLIRFWGLRLGGFNIDLSLFETLQISKTAQHV